VSRWQSTGINAEQQAAAISSEFEKYNPTRNPHLVTKTKVELDLLTRCFLESENVTRPVTCPPTPPKDAELIDLTGKAKPLVVPGHHFPRFKDAEVSIVICKNQKKYSQYNYQLHMATLSQNSEWFKNTLSQEIEEYDGEFAAKMKRLAKLSHRYELEHDLASGRRLLVKSVSGFSSPPQDFVAFVAFVVFQWHFA
jgi:hypothetical protein